MAEVDFERRIERFFADAPEMSDALAFAQRVERRLDRSWTTRRWLIGAAGVIGGVVGASQLIVSNAFTQMESASQDSVRLVSVGLDQVAPRLQGLPNLPMDGVAWAAAALAVAAMGFALSRVIEEI